jgi:choline dehydrogenase-like flavoprotein
LSASPLVDAARVTLLTGAEVTRLETDDSGRTVTGLVVSRDGGREVYRGDIVALSAGAANSAKILLNSVSDAHPHGLANGSDQVGRNYTYHNCKAIVALPTEKNDTTFRRHWASTTSTSGRRTTSGRWATSR